MDVRGKKVIVTGGVRGLGRSIVEILLAKEAQVTVLDLNAQGLRELQEQHPRVSCMECDISDYAKVLDVTSQYHAQFKSADVLINNAGILYSAPLIRISASGTEKHDAALWN